MKHIARLALALLTLPLLASCGGGSEPPGEEFVMTATVTALGEKLEVEVISGPYEASGPYWVITGKGTSYFGKDNKRIPRSAIAVGDTVEISYGGQVMMSYPPQIAALSIKVLSRGEG